MVNLYLNDVLVDVSNDTKFDITFTSSNIDKLTGGSVRGTFSYEIDLPATNLNKQLFYFPELILEDSFDDAIEKTARLEVNGNVILNGFARIKSTIVNNSLISYSVILYEGNSGWISQMKDKDLTELSNISDYDHIYNETNQTLSEDLANGLPYAYPLINLGRNTKGVSEWSIEDRYPAFSVWWIYQQIFKDAGYTIESNFINSDFFKRLFVTTDKIPERSVEETRPHKFNVRKTGVTYLSYDGDDSLYNIITRVPFNNAEPTLAY